MFDPRRTVVAVPSLVAAVAWGAMFPVAGDALERIDPVSLTTVRFALATAVFLAVLAAVEGRRALRAQGRWLELLVYGSLGFAGHNLLAYVALELTRPQDVALIVATLPLLTALALWLITRRPPPRTTLVAMVVALVGVCLVISRGDLGALLEGDGVAGELVVLTGCLGWVAYTLGTRRFEDFSPLRYTVLTAAYGTITILAVAAGVLLTGVVDAPTAADMGAVWWQIGYIVGAATVIALIAWNEGVRRLGPANAALFFNLVPVVAFAIAIGVQGYEPAFLEVVGAALTIGALVFANLTERAAEAPSASGSRSRRSRSRRRPA